MIDEFLPSSSDLGLTLAVPTDLKGQQMLVSSIIEHTMKTPLVDQTTGLSRGNDLELGIAQDTERLIKEPRSYLRQQLEKIPALKDLFAQPAALQNLLALHHWQYFKFSTPELADIHAEYIEDFKKAKGGTLPYRWEKVAQKLLPFKEQAEPMIKEHTDKARRDLLVNILNIDDVSQELKTGLFERFEISDSVILEMISNLKEGNFKILEKLSLKESYKEGAQALNPEGLGLIKVAKIIQERIIRTLNTYCKDNIVKGIEQTMDRTAKTECIGLICQDPTNLESGFLEGLDENSLGYFSYIGWEITFLEGDLLRN